MTAALPAAPLAGLRVVVTRAADQVGPLSTKLVDLGAIVVATPLIEIAPPSDDGVALHRALAGLGEYDWLVITSPNGAAAVRAALTAQITPTESGRRPLVAAVGNATAEALGVVADLVPEQQLAEALVAVFPTGPGRVLVAQSEQADDTVAVGLRAKGWQVDIAAAYRTVPVRPSAAQLLATLSADVVLFASGSAVRAWVAAFGDALPPFAAAIGPATAAVAAAVGLKIEAVAADHSLDGLVAVLLAHFGGAK